MCTSQAQQLTELAVGGLGQSARCDRPADRYLVAQLSALRAATAVVAERSAGISRSRRARMRNVWQLLAAVAPELAEWAVLFHASSQSRASVQAGTRCVTWREADDCLRDAATFVARVSRVLGLPAREVDVSPQWIVAG